MCFLYLRNPKLIFLSDNAISNVQPLMLALEEADPTAYQDFGFAIFNKFEKCQQNFKAQLN